MGCISNRIIFEPNQECDNLMQLNLLVLRAIEILSLKKNRQAFAMYIIYIHKKTEKFYSLTKQYRDCWKNCISNNLSCRVNNSHVKKFQMMQDAEKSILLRSNKKFSKVLCQLEPSSQKDFSDLCSFMVFLESDKNTVCQLKPLYSKFQDYSEKQLEHSIALYGKLTEDEEKIIKDIRKITIDTYSDPLNIVYYRESFVPQEKEEICKFSLQSTTAKNSVGSVSLNFSIKNDLEDCEMGSSSESFSISHSSDSFNME